MSAIVKHSVRLAVMVAAFSIAAVALYVATSVRAPGSVSSAGIEGCRPADVDSIVESKAVTPFEDQTSHIPDVAINPDGSPSMSATAANPRSLDGLPVAWIGAPRGSNAEAFYLNDPIGPKMTRATFYDAGGLSELTYPYDALSGDYAANLQAQLGDRVTLVKVGDVDGVLTWWDPLSNGVRPHELAWVSDGMVHAIIGVRAAEAMVNLARGMAC
ncbi:MAG TPA: hypothetical protein VFI15_02595 [Candidatus Limnocylindrales bacterium]|nr:hypothetical protein [Candidatus Limnocylindrales bacterium]